MKSLLHTVIIITSFTLAMPAQADPCKDPETAKSMPGYCGKNTPKDTRYFKIAPSDTKSPQSSGQGDMIESESSILDQDQTMPPASETLPCDIHQAETCYDTAINLHYGQDGPKDKATAHRIFSKLCENKMGKACHAAAMHINRYSPKPDFQRFLSYQLKGCDFGTAQSCFIVARSYEAPWDPNVETDHAQAKKYFNKACKLGFEMGCQYAKVKATGHRLR